MYRIKFLFTSIATACLLAACGGGGGGGGGTDTTSSSSTDNNSNPTTPATPTQKAAGEDIQGVWQGSAQGGNLQWDTTAVAMKDGRFYLVYSEYGADTFPNNRNKIGGFAVGKGTAANGSFSFNGREFNFEDAAWFERAATLTATYDNNNLQGQVSYPSDFARNFTTNYMQSYEGSPLYSELVFNNPNNPYIQGTFYKPLATGSSQRDQVTLVVNQDWTITSRNQTTECNVTGRLQPDAERKVFEATINFTSPSPEVRCPYAANTTFTGVAFLKNDAVAATAGGTPTANRFHMVLTSPNDEQGVAFVQIQ